MTSSREQKDLPVEPFSDQFAKSALQFVAVAAKVVEQIKKLQSDQSQKPALEIATLRHESKSEKTIEYLKQTLNEEMLRIGEEKIYMPVSSIQRYDSEKIEQAIEIVKNNFFVFTDVLPMMIMSRFVKRLIEKGNTETLYFEVMRLFQQNTFSILHEKYYLLANKLLIPYELIVAIVLPLVVAKQAELFLENSVLVELAKLPDTLPVLVAPAPLSTVHMLGSFEQGTQIRKPVDNPYRVNLSPFKVDACEITDGKKIFLARHPGSEDDIGKLLDYVTSNRLEQIFVFVNKEAAGAATWFRMIKPARYCHYAVSDAGNSQNKSVTAISSDLPFKTSYSLQIKDGQQVGTSSYSLKVHCFLLNDDKLELTDEERYSLFELYEGLEEAPLLIQAASEKLHAAVIQFIVGSLSKSEEAILKTRHSSQRNSPELGESKSIKASQVFFVKKAEKGILSQLNDLTDVRRLWR